MLKLIFLTLALASIVRASLLIPWDIRTHDSALIVNSSATECLSIISTQRIVGQDFNDVLLLPLSVIWGADVNEDKFEEIITFDLHDDDTWTILLNSKPLFSGEGSGNDAKFDDGAFMFNTCDPLFTDLETALNMCNETSVLEPLRCSGKLDESRIELEYDAFRWQLGIVSIDAYFSPTTLRSSSDPVSRGYSLYDGPIIMTEGLVNEHATEPHDHVDDDAAIGVMVICLLFLFPLVICTVMGFSRRTDTY